MPRLIDADALINGIEDDCWCLDLEYYSDRQALKSYINNQPTIDAEPVRHGRWIVDDLGSTRCSKCGKRLPFFHCYFDEPNSDYDEEWDEEIPKTRYCPNCGAKMRCDNDQK